MEWAVWVGFTLVVIGAVVGIFYWGGFSRRAPMTRTKGGMWFFAFIFLTMAISQLLKLRATPLPQAESAQPQQPVVKHCGNEGPPLLLFHYDFSSLGTVAVLHSESSLAH